MTTPRVLERYQTKSEFFDEVDLLIDTDPIFLGQLAIEIFIELRRAHGLE